MLPALRKTSTPPAQGAGTQITRDLPSSASEREAPREVARHVTSIGVTLDEWVSDFEKASELDAGISQSSAKDVLSKSLADNADPNVGCKFAAFDVVSAVSSIDTWVLGEKAEPRNQSHGQEKAASSRRDSSMHYQSTVFTLYASWMSTMTSLHAKLAI